MDEPPKYWHTVAIDALVDTLDTSVRGLTTATAERRLSTVGPNEITETRATSTLAILLEQFRPAIVWILVVAAVVMSVVGKPIEAVVILASACRWVSVGLR